LFVDYRDSAFRMTDDEYARVYEAIGRAPVIDRPTDLNDACLEMILDNVVGESVLDAGCGRGHLCGRLADTVNDVVGVDYAVPTETADDRNVSFVTGSVTRLPFGDDRFDTVVCSHTLEHVPDIAQALFELRRVAKKRLVIVVPKERPYRWGPNLHCHFFPYRWSVDAAFGINGRSQLHDLGDWLYIEEQTVDAPQST
jgi:ubiquinone/menaquinone biosynthesis C-methylase UbiE